MVDKIVPRSVKCTILKEYPGEENQMIVGIALLLIRIVGIDELLRLILFCNF